MIVHLPVPAEPRVKEHALRALQEVFGVVWITLAERLPACRKEEGERAGDLGELHRRLVELARSQFVRGQSFCVRVNRGNKTLPFASPALASELGQSIREQTEWNRVDLTHPDVTFHVDLRCGATFLFGTKLRGPGGLPVGTAGRVLALLSGGIDSPVAAYLMAKRGCRTDFLHFSATHLGPEDFMATKVGQLARQLGRYTLGGRVFVVPYVHFDLALLRHKVEYELVLFRRFMLRVAERLGRSVRARALVTGDNLSQVASQTMTNLISTSEACQLLVLRPLIGFDKEETIALAQKIGTYQVSIQPYKDCCALISGHPKTRSFPERLKQLEARAFPDYEQLIERTLADVVTIDLASMPT